MRFTATVKNNKVVIRDVPMPDGKLVEVVIEPSQVDQDPDFPLTEEELRGLAEGERDLREGRWKSADDFFRDLGRPDLVRGQDVGATRTSSRARSRKLGSARPGTKSAAGRRRRRA